MLKVEKEIIQAVCDACGKDLRYFWKEDQGKCRSANYGELTPHFGYGSDLDSSGGQIRPHYILCDDCFTKAVHAVGLPIGDYDPAVCPVCHKSRNGADDHPDCMKTWYPHPGSDPQKEAEQWMEERRKRAPLREKAFWWRRWKSLKEGGRQIRDITPEMIEARAKYYEFDTKPPTEEEVREWEKRD